jgi:hypothetical protein
MGNIKREQKSFIDAFGMLNYWCAECMEWHLDEPTEAELKIFGGK